MADLYKDVIETDQGGYHLEPCPHCGHRAIQPERVHGEHWGSWDWRILCSNSHCCARVQIIADTWLDRDKQCVRMWNRRALIPPTGDKR